MAKNFDSGVRRCFGVEGLRMVIENLKYIAVAGYARHKSSYDMLPRKILDFHIFLEL